MKIADKVNNFIFSRGTGASVGRAGDIEKPPGIAIDKASGGRYNMKASGDAEKMLSGIFYD